MDTPFWLSILIFKIFEIIGVTKGFKKYFSPDDVLLRNETGRKNRIKIILNRFLTSITSKL